MLSARDLRHVNGDVPRDPAGNGIGLANRDDLGLQPRAEASPPVLVSRDEIGPARLVGRRPHDGFGLLEIATRGGLGEAARLPSILPPPQPRGRHEDDRAHQADQDEIDAEDQQHPEPHLGHCPHLPPSAPGPHRQEDSQRGSQ
jgi:hypothetical protein